MKTFIKKFSFAVCAFVLAGSAFAQHRGDVICSYAPSQTKAVSTIAGTMGGAGVATAAITKTLGLTAVTHSSGALIMTGSGGYIAGTLGSALIAPAIITVSLVVGGAALTVELVCAPKNHPAYTEKVIKAAEDFRAGYPGSLVDVGSEHIERVAVSFKKIKGSVFDYINKF